MDILTCNYGVFIAATVVLTCVARMCSICAHKYYVFIHIHPHIHTYIQVLCACIVVYRLISHFVKTIKTARRGPGRSQDSESIIMVAAHGKRRRRA